MLWLSGYLASHLLELFAEQDLSTVGESRFEGLGYKGSEVWNKAAECLKYYRGQTARGQRERSECTGVCMSDHVFNNTAE